MSNQNTESSREEKSPDCTFKNDFGDSVTISRGGFNNDNATGKVRDRDGKGVLRADVEIHNRTNDERINTVTSRVGAYDEDVNAAEGHEIEVKVSFTEGSEKHFIEGVCTVK